MAYLFVYFCGDKKDEENVYFSISVDGLNWEDLNNGKPVLYSNNGMGGVRDPFIVKHPITNKYYMMATDLCIYSGVSWEMAQTNGSKNIIVWESKDLVHWSSARTCRVGVKNAGCVWAPEAIYENEQQSFLVYWASKIIKNNKEKFCIYASYTKNFKDYTEPFLFLEKNYDVIDTTIINADGIYYRFSKMENTGDIILESSQTITGPYKEIPFSMENIQSKVEGPQCFWLENKKQWCFIVDNFAKGTGYTPFLIKSLRTGELEKLNVNEYDMGASCKRHGGVISINKEEYMRLKEKY